MTQIVLFAFSCDIDDYVLQIDKLNVSILQWRSIKSNADNDFTVGPSPRSGGIGLQATAFQAVVIDFLNETKRDGLALRGRCEDASFFFES